MRFMFRYNTSFSGNVSSWDTSKATSFFQTFMNANAFNSNVSSWNTSNVKDMSYMFFGANTFNQNLSSWNVSNVATFEAMFYFARSFNQDLGRWSINKNSALNFTRFANTSGMSNTNFTRLLISFANQAKAAGDNPKAATFGLMSDRFYKPAYSTNNFGTAIQTGADAKTYLFDAGSPVAWINFDARIDSTP